jgi:acyl-CoA thioesterase
VEAQPIETPSELLARLKREWEATPCWRWMGITLEAAEPGRVELAMPLRPEMINSDDNTLHGGIIATLIDSAVGLALCTVYHIGVDVKGHTTTDLNVSYLEGVFTPGVTVEGRVIRKGRTLVVGEATVFDNNGKRCSVGRATYMVFR